MLTRNYNTCAEDESHGCDETQTKNMEPKKCFINRLHTTIKSLSVLTQSQKGLPSIPTSISCSNWLLTEKKLSKKVKNHQVIYTVTAIGKRTALQLVTKCVRASLLQRPS